MRYLKTNTATIVTVGPFLDKGDGVTLETGLTITDEKISFVVDLNNGSAPTLVLDNVTGATSGTSNDLNYITNCDAGLMQLELAAANVNYLGRAFLTITDAANHCPVFHEFTILPAMVYDSLIAGTDVLQADMTQILGTAVSSPATAGILDVNLKNIANAAVSTSTAQLGVNVVQISGDGPAADNAESFFDGTGYAGTNNVIPLVTTTTTATTTTNLTNLPAAAATAAELAKVPKSDSTVSWNATALAAINAEVDTALNTAIPGSPTANSVNERVATMDGLLLGTVAAGTHVAQSGDSFARLGAPAGASVSADILVIDNFVDDLETRLTATRAGYLDQLEHIHDSVESILTDTGTTLDALIKDIPTNAELATALGTADDAVLAILGTPAGASVSADVLQIKNYVDDIGVAGAGLTAIPTIAAVTTVGSVTGAVGSVTGAVGSIAANGITATSIAADAINAAAVKADAVTKIQNGLATPTNITAGTITTVTNLTNLPAAAALEATLTAMKGATFNGTTDSLEALRDRGDAAWVTATGFATPTNITAGTITTVGNVTGAVGSVTGLTAADVGAIKTTIGTAGAGLTALGDTRLANLDAAITTRSTYAGADTAGTTTLLGIFSGMTSLPKWLRGLFRKDAMDATAKSEINTGGGTFAETTDSNEAIRDTAPLGTAMRGTDGAYTGTPPDAATIAGAVLDEAKGAHSGHLASIPTNPYTGTPPAASDIKTALEADGSKLDHLWEMTVDDAGVRQFTANALELAPTGGGGGAVTISAGGITAASFAASAIDATALATSAVNEIAAAVLAGGTPSTYSYSNTVDDGSGNLLDGVLVELSTTIGMTNIIFSTHTNSSGAFTVYSDIAGAHYLRLQLSGYSFTIQTVTLA